MMVVCVPADWSTANSRKVVNVTYIDIIEKYLTLYW